MRTFGSRNELKLFESDAEKNYFGSRQESCRYLYLRIVAMLVCNKAAVMQPRCRM